MTVIEQLVVSDPEIMSGTPCFAGTRVPFQTIWDHLAEGEPLSVFLEDFPSVSREQAIEALVLGRDLILAKFQTPRTR